MLRLSSAETRGEYIFTFGLTLLEAGVLLYLESVANGMRQQHLKHETAFQRVATDNQEIGIREQEVTRPLATAR